MKPRNPSPRLTGALLTAAMLALLLPLSYRFTVLQREGFCRPAAVLAGAILDAPVLPHPSGNGYAIAVASLPIQVAMECSGMRFCCIAWALFAGLCVERRRPALAPAMLPLAYGITLIANTSRILSGWQAQRWARPHLATTDLTNLHMLVGALCFFLFLLLAYMLIERSLTHERASVAA